MSVIHSPDHGFSAGDRIVFGAILPTDTGIDESVVYYVLASGLTTDDFEFSETDGGAAFTFAEDITSGSVSRAPGYSPVGTDDVMAAPTEPTAPNSPSVSGTSVSGLVRLKIVLDPYTDPATRIRQHEYQVTHHYSDETAIAGTITGSATTDFITKTAHGFAGGETFRFKTLTGGTGINLEQTYYVLAAGLTADTFQFSTTSGGAAVDFTADITDGTIAQVVTPYPDWSYSTTLNLPASATDITIPALPSTAYAVRGRVEDVYGLHSDWCAVVELTTDAGNDALYASLTEIANGVQDGSITNDGIADNADIVGSKIKAGTITANLLASTMVISSLFTTGLSGARVDWDENGIRLFDASDNLIVNMDTATGGASFNGDVTSANLVSLDAATFYGSTTFPGDAVVVLANGIEAPTNTPTLAKSLDHLPLTSTPPDVNTARGIAYGTNSSGTDGFWIAADPTQSGGYVAHHFNTSGVYTESINATGSTTTYTTTMGATSHVSDSAQARSSADVQVATPLTSHATRANQKITKVSFYAAGYSGGTPTVRGAVWNNSNTKLGNTASTTLPAKAFANGNSVQNNLTMTSPLSISADTTYRVGWYQTSSEGIQWDRNDGSGKTQYRGDGGSGSLSIVETLTSSKPNVYYTYTYDVDTRLETAVNIGIAVDGTYIYTLDANGILWQYQRTTLAYVAQLDLSGYFAASVPTANAGLYYDATAGNLKVITFGGVTGTDKVRAIIATTGMAYSTTTDGTTGTTFDGATAVVQGGAYAETAQWASINGTVYNLGTTYDVAANHDFGSTTYNNTGLCHDGTQFRGYSGSALPTRIHIFTSWDWTTESAVYWIGYAWYQTTGGYVTPVGPRASITMARRQRLSVTSAALPSGVSHARIFAYRGASDPGATGFWKQVDDAVTQRYLTSYTGSGTADVSTSTFPAGTAAVLKDSSAKWQLKGDGSVTFDTTVTPGGKPPTVTVYEYTGSSQTWNKPTGLAFAKVELVGGGGGGGAAESGASVAVGAGGGGGGYAMKVFTAANLSGASSFTVDIGVAGSGGTAGGDGGSGGNTSFSGTGITTMTANGGGGGQGQTNGTSFASRAGGAGGTASNGEMNATGSDGNNSIRLSGTTYAAMGNGGAAAAYSGMQRANATTAGGAGAAGTKYGGGGAGGHNGGGAGGQPGGDGYAGVAIVTAYFGA